MTAGEGTDENVRGLRVAEGTVKPEWIDYNEHMNVAYYVLAFDYAIDALWARIGITDDYIRDTRGSTFAVETHVTYQGELRERDPYFVTTELMAYDAKRIHQFQRMYHAGERFLAATAEWLSLHVDLGRRKVAPWPPSVLAELAVIADGQTDLARLEPPEELSGKIRVREPIYSLYAQEPTR